MMPAALAKTASALAVIFDSGTDSRYFDAVRQLGGGWPDAVAGYLEMRDARPFAVLLASTRDRLTRGAPLLIAAPTISEAGRFALDKMPGGRCAWVFMCSERTRDTFESLVLDAEVFFYRRPASGMAGHA